MNVALAVAGVLLLAGFVAVWPPAGLLLAGLFFLGLAQLRRINQARGGDRT